MSANEQDRGAPIGPGSPLARTLGDFAVPELSSGFAERVLAAAEVRPPPLPSLRRSGAQRRWRLGQRIAIGLASFGALATAAAATGLLQQIAIPVPSPGTVWAALTGAPTASPAPKARIAVATPTPASPPVAIEGPVDTPEELGEAFRRMDQLRADRRKERHSIIEQFMSNANERRRAAGLPLLSPEEEARLRARIESEVAQREERADAAIAARRETMQRKIESGEPLKREDFSAWSPVDPGRRDTLRELRQLSPAERRETWRKLPPEQRRALTDELRARRAMVRPAPTDNPAPDPLETAPEGQE